MALKTPREAAITYPTEYVKTQLQLQSTHGLWGEVSGVEAEPFGRLGSMCQHFVPLPLATREEVEP